MIRLAFSSIACHEWPLDRLIESAADWGYDGVELRTFGSGSTRFCCDPALTGGDKLRRMFLASGLVSAGLATGLTLDDPIRPPVMGHLLPASWKCIDEGRSLIEIAGGFGAPFVRVFPFRVPKGPLENRHGTLKRIASRASRLGDSCRHRNVVVLMENGGDFGSAEDLIEIVTRAAHPNVRACYDIFAGLSAGDDPVAAIARLGDALAMVRVRDRRGDNPVELGTGELPNRDVVRALSSGGFAGWIAYEWERAWIDGLASPELVLPKAAATMAQWIGAGRQAGAHSAA